MPQQSFTQGHDPGAIEKPQIPMCRTCGNVPLGNPHTCYGVIFKDPEGTGPTLKVQRQFLAKGRKTILHLENGMFTYRDGRPVDKVADLEGIVNEPFLTTAKAQVEGPEKMETPPPEQEEAEEPALGYTEEGLSKLKYFRLQAIARELGIQANQRKEVLTEQILHVQKYGYHVPKDE